MRACKNFIKGSQKIRNKHIEGQLKKIKNLRLWLKYYQIKAKNWMPVVCVGFTMRKSQLCNKLSNSVISFMNNLRKW